MLGLAIAGLAIGFGEATDKPRHDVLFSGQDAIGPLVGDAAGWSVGALLLLVVCKGLAYSDLAQLVPRRPGVPVDVHRRCGRDRRLAPPGLPMIPAVAMGIGAMCAVMLTLPFTATLLATLLLGADGVQAMPVVIVAVVIAYVVTARLTPLPEPAEPAPRHSEVV